MRSIAVFFLVATTAVVDAGEVQLKIPVEPNSREVVVTGQGLSVCSQFLADRETYSAEVIDREACFWTLGYVTALNMARINGGRKPKDLRALIHPGANMRTRMAEYCNKQHPLKNYVTGVHEFFDSLPDAELQHLND